MCPCCSPVAPSSVSVQCSVLVLGLSQMWGSRCYFCPASDLRSGGCTQPGALPLPHPDCSWGFLTPRAVGKGTPAQELVHALPGACCAPAPHLQPTHVWHLHWFVYSRDCDGEPFRAFGVSGNPLWHACWRFTTHAPAKLRSVPGTMERFQRSIFAEAAAKATSVFTEEGSVDK